MPFGVLGTESSFMNYDIGNFIRSCYIHSKFMISATHEFRSVLITISMYICKRCQKNIRIMAFQWMNKIYELFKTCCTGYILLLFMFFKKIRIIYSILSKNI